MSSLFGPRLVAVIGAAVLAAGLTPRSASAEAPAVPERSGTWAAVAAGPLSPRLEAQAVWTGAEVLVFGGNDLSCDTGHCYPGPEDALVDGAAYNPILDAWRPIAPMPVRTRFPTTVVAGGVVYLDAPEVRPVDAPGYEARRHWLAYSVAQDTWREIRRPPGEGVPVAVGTRLIAADVDGDSYAVYDAAGDSWSALPPSPLGPSYGGQAVGDGLSRLYAIGAPPERPGASEAETVASNDRAAVLDLATGAWTPLPEPGFRADGTWYVAGGRLVNPSLGRPADSMATFDPLAGRWSTYPQPARPENPWQDGNEAWWPNPTAGGSDVVLGANEVLHAPTMTWTRIRQHVALGDWNQAIVVDFPAVTWAGDRMFVWGGNQRWDGAGPGGGYRPPPTVLRGGGWTWRP